MNVVAVLQKPEIRTLRERYHELTGFWVGYHWTEYSSIEDYVEKLKAKIAKAEKELAGKNDDQNHP